MKTSALPKPAGANAMGRDIRTYKRLLRLEKAKSIKDHKGPSEMINR